MGLRFVKEYTCDVCQQPIEHDSDKDLKPLTINRLTEKHIYVCISCFNTIDKFYRACGSSIYLEYMDFPAG